MNNVSLVLYVIRVREVENVRGGRYYNLDNIEGRTFMEIFKDYCDTRRFISCNKGIQKAASIKRIDIENENFSGLIECGNYGYSSEIKSIETSRTTHLKTNSEVEMIPFFFSGKIPKDSYKGLIALEKFKTFGCKTVLEDDFNKFLHESDLKFRITLHPILPEKVAKQYLQAGNICKIRLVKHSVPKSIEYAYSDKYKLGEFGTFEYVINPRRNKTLSFKSEINKYLNNQKSIRQVIEVQGLEYDNVKVELEIGSKKRTISLNHIDKLTGDIDISNEIEFDTSGHPRYSSILNIANDIIREYIEVIDYKNYEIKPVNRNNCEERVNEHAMALQQ
ncbi:TPA: hypothetical protein K8N22_000787 [Clostridium perfringens]|nr:hypothetical protein [Clostridium perfringens]HBI7046834.1 hypothetical protein [Clostridium perfringens]HBI7052049.1 hypothetical protein [Clostridium perfringens]HBI7344113.1 hypothetical protein [Clostridium perfringens]